MLDNMLVLRLCFASMVILSGREPIICVCLAKDDKISRRRRECCQMMKMRTGS